MNALSVEGGGVECPQGAPVSVISFKCHIPEECIEATGLHQGVPQVGNVRLESDPRKPHVPGWGY